MLLVTPHLSVTPHLREVSDDIDMWYRHFDDHRDFDSANRTGMCTGMFAVLWIDIRHVAGRLRPVSRQSPLPCHVIIVPPRTCNNRWTTCLAMRGTKKSTGTCRAKDRRAPALSVIQSAVPQYFHRINRSDKEGRSIVPTRCNILSNQEGF